MNDESGGWVGIDVSKSHLDVFAGGQHRRFRVKDQVDVLVAWMGELRPEGIVLEATGGYEEVIAKALHHRHAVAIVNPRWVRDFAKSRGRLAKTDRLDARLLAEFGATNKPRPTRLLSDIERRLRAAVVRRDQVVDLRQLAKQHLEHTTDAQMLARAKQTVAELDVEVRSIDGLIAKLIAEDEAIAASAKRMRTVPGIGPVIAAALIVYFPELGQLTNRQAAALAGLAPMNCDSGAMRGQRHIRGGRFRIRRLLFLAATVNQRCHESRFKDRFTSLVSRAKPKKVARIAVARKLLITLNAMLRHGADYAADYVAPQKSAA